MTHPVLEPVWEELEALAGRRPTARVELQALRYLIDPQAEAGRKTVAETLAILQESTFPDEQDISRQIGRTMVTGAVVYDWCYELLTPEQKQAYIDQFIRLARLMECGYPPARQGSVTGHSSERMIMRDMLSAGIAIYDEAPEMYRLAAGRFFSQHLPARNWFYPGHAYHQGDSYGSYRYASDLYPLWIFSRMGAGNVYNQAQQYVPYQWIYMRRPDGQLIRSGDTYLHSRSPGQVWPLEMATILSASFYGDGYVYGEFLKEPSVSAENKLFELLWRDPDLKARPASELPLTRYMGSPFGWMIARTAWDENAAIVEMKINEYNFTNHQHLDAGSFQIYYRGALAIDSGLYSGSSGAYGSPHTTNYYWRTIAHNSLLVYNPEEVFSQSRQRDYGNDGGQRLPNGRSEPRNLDDLLTRGYATGQVLARDFGPAPQRPRYSYLKGDITPAYSDKVRQVVRSMVFLNLEDDVRPGALVVCDRVVSSDPAFKKYWLLHSIEEPQIEAPRAVIARTDGVDRGRLYLAALLPAAENLAIEKLGGPGNEFSVFGRNYPNDIEPRRRASQEPGAWRIEISPRQPAAEDLFLNVLQIADSSAGEPLPVEHIEGQAIVGARIADRVVLFSASGAPLSGEIRFTLPGDKPLEVLAADLAAGSWQLARDGQPAASVVSREPGYAAYFAAAPGEYTLQPGP
jgi:heparin/heparan-sulfate lyase